MTFKSVSLAALAALALAACATNDTARLDGNLTGDQLALEAEKVEAEGRKAVVCRREKTTGSHRTTKRCVPYSVYRDEQEESRKAMSRMQGSNAQRGTEGN